MLITDPAASRRPLREAVTAAVSGGVDLVQVRGPGLGARELRRLVLELKDPVHQGGARIIVNDRVDVALATGADGVHLKRNSLGPAQARELLGKEAFIGVSTHREEEVTAAFDGGADYVVFGPVFATPSKEGIFEPCGPSHYGRVARSAPGPVLALGGIDRDTLPALLVERPRGVALIRGILAAEDPEAAAREIRALLAAGESAS